MRQAGAAAAATRDDVAGVGRAAGALSWGEVVKGAAAFAAIESAARSVVSAVSALPAEGIRFLADTETSQLGMAGILQSMVEIEGKAPSFAQAQDMAAGAVGRLQKAAAETAASSDDLITTYSALLGPALAAGMTMQQVEQFTVVGANAVKSLGLTTGQMVQELRDLTQGGITAAGSTIATSLGLKDEDISKAKSSSEGLFSFLMGRMQGFASTSQAYSSTLKGGWEALQEQMTQASASALAPAAEAAKGAIAQIAEALKSDQAVAGLQAMGQGAASVISVLSSGIGVVQQYGGAIALVAGAYAAVQVGRFAADIAAATSAKLEGVNASRLAAAQTAIEAGANERAAQSSAQQLAALVAEERAKVSAMQTEVALTAAKLRTAEATAAQATGLQRLAVLESTVLPLRQQHAAQTAALEQAQTRLASATGAASLAARGMGVVMGALGGPIGIAITAVTMLIGALGSARAEAEKLGKTKVSVERVETTLAKGGKVDSTDAGRIDAAANDAREKRDEILARQKRGYSMGDRSKGMFGGDSVVEQDRKALAAAEAEVARYDGLRKRIDMANAPAAAGAGLPDVNLRAGVSSKALDSMLDKVKTAGGIKEEGDRKLKDLETLAERERALMVKRQATAKEMAAFDERVAAGRAGIKRDTAAELQSLAAKEKKVAGGGVEHDASAIEKAAADLRLAQLKQANAARSAELDREQADLESLHQRGIIGAAAYEDRKLAIQRERLGQRLALIDEEIADESKRAPVKPADRLQREKRVVELQTERASITSDIKGAEQGAAAAAAARELEQQRARAAEGVQVWQEATQQILQQRQANAQAAAALITDPAERLRVETTAQVAQIQRTADLLSDKLKLQISLTTDEGQRGQLEQVLQQHQDETAKAVDLAQRGLAAKLKPGWVTMVEGWGDANKLMRETSDATMQTLVSGGEQAFTTFAKTGKLSSKSLADDLRGQLASSAYRQMMGSLFGGGAAGGAGMAAGAAGAAGGGGGGLAGGLIAGAMKWLGGSKPAAGGGLMGPPAPTGDAASQALSGVAESATEASGAVAGIVGSLGRFGDGLSAGISGLGGFASSIGNALSGLFSGGGAAAGGGGAGFFGAIASLFAADGASFGAGGVRAFASGGSFTDRIIDRDTHFRYREGGREKLGLMGEAGPEAIMPLSGGGAMAIDRTGRRIGHLPVTRGPGGRLSVMLDERAGALSQSAPSAISAASTRRGGVRAFADGGAFGAGGALTSSGAQQQQQQQQKAQQQLQLNAPLSVEITDMGMVQNMIRQAMAAHERALMSRLRAAGVGV